MIFFESLFLGIVQGISEFFPVSSSAHLKLAKLFFKSDSINDLYLFDLICHLGTLIASIIFLRKEIAAIFKDKKKALLFVFALLPLFPFYFFLKPLREFFSQTYFLPFFLLFTALVLFVSSKIKIKEIDPLTHKRKIKDVLFVGLMQAFALIPGISRSAFTISSAYFRGWKIQEAIRFSFLLAIPTILGGSFLESFKHLLKKEVSLNLPISSYVIGFLASFFVGIFAIRYIFSIDTHKKLRPFAIYLFCLAIFSFIFLNVIN
ncbi:MAG: Undecaprenyl-diphosphatase [Candidatus Anoxychlamydiales bacterium]|nr:Undecaprenyl-diphosphatase [Candidatus Anoxychlamydiales bacterium]